MVKDIKLKIPREKSIEIINEHIDSLRDLEAVENIENVFKEIIISMNNALDSQEVIERLKAKTKFQFNTYSKEMAKENAVRAKDNVISYLEEVLSSIKENDYKLSDYNAEFSKEVALLIVKKILNNFYMHIEAMYEADVHGKAGITKENLSKIKIKNEYDVQRILYSLVKPIFPSARLEVVDDTGNSSIRYDICIDNFSIVIEAKCSRPSMSERSLEEEISADIVRYRYENIFFFVFDKEKVVKNTKTFTEYYNRNFDEKNVVAVVLQPVIL